MRIWLCISHSLRLFLAMSLIFIALACTSREAWGVFDTTVKSFGGVDWYHLHTEYGTTETQLSATGNPLNGGPYLSFRNATSAAPGNNGTGGANIWLNNGAGNNLSVNTSFWEVMRTSSYSTNDTTPWFRYALRMNYDLGLSQNDLAINGVGTQGTSTSSGTLPYEPPAFGGDRFNIGRQFDSAYDITIKGTSLAYAEWQAFNAGSTTTWEEASGPISSDHVAVPGFGGNYDASNGDIVEVTVGKRPDGTLDIYFDAPLLKGSTPSHFVSTLSTDNPDWFFYQLELRARGSGAPLYSVQDLLLFEFGNDWGDLGGGVWGVLSELESENLVVPEPSSMMLLGLGSLLFAVRRRRK